MSTNGPIWVPTGPGDNVSGVISDPGLTSIAAAVAAQIQPSPVSANFNTGLGCALATNAVYTATSLTVSPVMGSVYCDATTGPITITLPALSPRDLNYEFVKIDNTEHTVTIVCAAGDNFVTDVSSYVLGSQNDFMNVYGTDDTPAPQWIIMAARLGGFPPLVPDPALVAAAAAAILNTPHYYSTTATVQPSDTLIIVTATAPWSLTLPAISVGVRRLLISKQGTGTNIVTIKCAGSDTFADGTTTRALTQRPDYFDLFIDPTAGHWAFLGARQAGVPV